MFKGEWRRIQGLGLKDLGFGVQGFGSRIYGLGI